MMFLFSVIWSSLLTIDRRPIGSTGAFFRLCGRSPKDGEPRDRAAVWAQYTAELQRLLAAGEPDTVNTKLRAISRTQWLRVRCGADVLSLMLTSERIYTDLHDWLEYGMRLRLLCLLCVPLCFCFACSVLLLRSDVSVGEPEQIVLRAWEPQLCLEYEFRAFVHGNKLNAISQYDHYAIYPNLPPEKPNFERMIRSQWERVHPLVGETSYIIDFAYLPDSDRMIVVELSPFRTCTGAACFSWLTERSLLENGPFEFRLNTKLHQQIEDLVETNWEDRWQKPIPPYESFYAQALVTRPAPAPAPVDAVVPAAPTASNAVTVTSSPFARAGRHLLTALAVGCWSAVVLNTPGPVRMVAGVCGVGAVALLVLQSARTRLHTVRAAVDAPQPVNATTAVAAPPPPPPVAAAAASATAAEVGTSASTQPRFVPGPGLTVEQLEQLRQSKQFLFVYGTLKRGFHWHSKFLSRARFVAAARATQPLPLVVGECGVPYLLGDLPRAAVSTLLAV